MKKAYDVYTEAIRDHFKIFYANWPIGTPIKLGDYGTMDGRIFIPEGNITDDFKIKFKIRTDTTKDHYYFKSTDSVKVEFFPKGSVSIHPSMPSIRASMRIEFAKEESVFFNSAGIRNHSIESIDNLGNIILSMFKNNKWSEKKVVVTRLVQADSATVIISGKSGASICLDAQSVAIPNINLADASIKFLVSVDNGIAFQIISEEGYFPMLGISGIKTKHWYLPGSKNEWEPTVKMVYMNINNVKKSITKKATTYNEFYFGDI